MCRGVDPFTRAGSLSEPSSSVVSEMVPCCVVQTGFELEHLSTLVAGTTGVHHHRPTTSSSYSVVSFLLF